MPDSAECREAIISESFRDFIGNHVRTEIFEQIAGGERCEQDAGFGYKCVYLPKETADPVNLSRFSYNSIPRCYSPLSMETLNQAGILPIQNYPTLQLRGNGVLIGFLDSGIDYENPVFRNLDGSTRIAGIWDQTIQTGTPPSGFAYGSEYTMAQIDQALASDDPRSMVPSTDELGHGTFAASLAAGSADPDERFIGAAPESLIAMVKLKEAKAYLKDYYSIPVNTFCWQETDLMLGLRYLNELADRLALPLVICLTMGTNMGGHTGTLPFPLLIDGYASGANRITVTGTGNEADQRHHYYSRLEDERDSRTIELRVGENVSGFSLELWTEIPNILSISLISPSGESTSRIPFQVGTGAEIDFLFEQTKVSVDYRLFVEKTTSELVFFRFRSPAPGIWRIVAEPVYIADGIFHMWLPLTEFLSGEVFFLESDPYSTLTNPANTASPVIVSWYNSSTGGTAQASGRGYTRSRGVNPDLTAPGVNVRGALPGGRYAARSGSCIASAITAGAIALMMEWLVYNRQVPGIDSYQIKSLLILGAVRPASMEYPNREWGYGQLNLYNTFEAMRKL